MNDVRYPWPSGYLRGEPSVIGNVPKKTGGVGCRGVAIDLKPKQLRFRPFNEAESEDEAPKQSRRRAKA